MERARGSLFVLWVVKSSFAQSNLSLGSISQHDVEKLLSPVANLFLSCTNLHKLPLGRARPILAAVEAT
jgi:hypothetical protein